jgi:hypothetical protein
LPSHGVSTSSFGRRSGWTDSVAVGRLAVVVGDSEGLAGRPLTISPVCTVRLGVRMMFLWHQRSCEIEQAGAQVRAVAEEVAGTTADGEQIRERREVALGLVAAATGEDEVITPVVSGLTAARRNVVERHHLRGEFTPAVGADRTVLFEQPCTRVGVGGATGRMRRQLERRRATSAAAAAAGAPANRRCCGSGCGGDGRRVTLLVRARVARRMRWM